MAAFNSMAAVFSDLSGLGKERKLKAIMGAALDHVLNKCPPHDVTRGVIREVGAYTVYGAVDIFGREVGSRMIDVSCVIAQEDRKLFDFRRDHVEIGLESAMACDIARGGWYRDFVHACRTGPVKTVEFSHGFPPINEQHDMGMRLASHRALDLFAAHRDARHVIARMKAESLQIRANPS